MKTWKVSELFTGFLSERENITAVEELNNILVFKLKASVLINVILWHKSVVQRSNSLK